MMFLDAFSLLLFLSSTAAAIISHPDHVFTGPLAHLNFHGKPEVTGKYGEGHVICVGDGRTHRISADTQKYGAYQYSDDGAPLVVQLDLAAAAAGPVNMIAKTGGLNESFPYVGAISGLEPLEADVVPDSLSLLLLGGTKNIALGKSELIGFNSLVDIFYSQSAIWRYDVDTGFLTPEWVNRDGSSLKLTATYNPHREAILMTANYSVLAAHFSGDRICQLQFEPIRASL